MKKTLKITGISLLILGLVLNLEYAFTEYYGIKAHNLTAQIWGQAIKIPYTNADATDGASGSTTSGSPINTGTSGEGEVNKFQRVTESRACNDVTANITFNSTSNGTAAGATVNLGPLGTWGVNTTGWGSSSGSAAITNYKVTFPKNPDGSAMQYQYVFCFAGGSSTCHSQDPCLNAAMGQIQAAMTSTN